MFAEQQREYLDKGYTKIESFFSAEEVAKILEDVKQIELGAIGVASDNETYSSKRRMARRRSYCVASRILTFISMQ